MDDPDLLYEDLFEDLEDGKAIIKTSLHEMEDLMKSLNNEAEELRLQVRNLQEQNEGLSKQNEVLIRNISCLFKTAQMEISRKDKQIRSLQEESLKFSKTGETCAASGGMGKRGPHGGKHGEYATMVSRGDNKHTMGETPFLSGGMGKQGRNGEYAAMASSEDCKGRMVETVLASNGTWKRGHYTHCDSVAVELQADRKGDMGETPLASDGMRRRGHLHRDYATMASQANHKGRTEETRGTDKPSHYEREQCEYAIKTSQVDNKGSMGETPLASDGIGKQGHYRKPADLEAQGNGKGRVKETLVESGGTGKLGHHDDKHGDYTAMTSRADCMETLSGVEKQDHRRADHRDYAEKSRSYGKGSEQQDEMWKRRRREGQHVAAGQEYQRRADERYPLDAKGEKGPSILTELPMPTKHQRVEERSGIALSSKHDTPPHLLSHTRFLY